MIKKYNNLETIEDFNKDHPLDYYPRPSLKREVASDTYLNLNGPWKYTTINEANYSNFLNMDISQDIIVPYPYESHLSGVEKRLMDKEFLIYQKAFTFKPRFERVILHFQAVDSKCAIYLNGEKIGNNVGGYLPFSFDITELYEEEKENILTVIVKDNNESYLPHGKQKIDNGGIWYTPVSGIWKSVWLESVPYNYISNISFETNVDNKEVKLSIIEDEPNEKEIKISLNGKILKVLRTKESTLIIPFDEISLWSPKSPTLYDIVVRTRYDEVSSYFAFRKIEIKNKKFYLNDEPIFMHGLLDQGYYPDGIYTPRSLDTVINELNTIKDLGFNTLRKHIKVEDEIWYYLCDKMGIIVWQDMINTGDYSFIMDTALPTIGLKNLKKKEKDNKAKDSFIKHAKETIAYLKNHPSIVLWTIFNEGWGQFESDMVYDTLREVDDTRIYDVNSGWFQNSLKTELDSRHIYFKPIVIDKESEKTLVISEFGGYSLKIENHIYSKKSFGYKGFKSLEEYNEGFKELYKRDIIDNIKKGLCASIYTQLSDVETEINGIMTYDRKVVKLDKNLAKEIEKEINDEFKKQL